MDQVTKAIPRAQLEAMEEAGKAVAPVAGAPDAKAPEAPKPAARLLGKKERTRTLKLEDPVEYDGVVYEELTFRRLTGKDFRQFISLQGQGEEIALPAMLTGVPREVIEALDGDDYWEVQLCTKDFIPRKLVAESEPTSESGQSTQQ